MKDKGSSCDCSGRSLGLEKCNKCLGVNEGISEESIIELWRLIKAQEDRSEAIKAKNGYWLWDMNRKPRTKKRRIINKWIKSGEAFKCVFVPPVSN